jgi:alpha-tubulin suppressor-like RCC1 family protein
VTVCTNSEDVCEPASGFTSVAAGAGYTCAVTAAGGVSCWGLNNFGQLGDGTNLVRHTPVSVCSETGCDSGLSGVSVVSAGQSHACALKTSGNVICWGSDGSGQLGNGGAGSSLTPVAVCGLPDETVTCTPLAGFVAVAAGGLHNCGLNIEQKVLCWGSNAGGQLGDGTLDLRQSPVYVCRNASCESPLDGVAIIDAGTSHSCVLLGDGGTRCWGRNFYGQLGDNTNANSSAPVTPCRAAGQGGATSGGASCAAADDLVAISLGAHHTCAITADTGVECWGANTTGQLGDGTTEDRDTLTSVCVEGCAGSLSGVGSVSAGSEHTCALAPAGDVWCWGRNNAGQLGDGTNTDRHIPVLALGVKPAPAPTHTATQLATATPSHTPTSSPTRTPVAAMPGDSNCDRVINAIDAALVLQYGAGLLEVLPCLAAADTNGDGSVNAIDGALILQYGAGLLDTLPP